MSKKGKESRKTTKLLQEAIQKPIATCVLTPKRMSNFKRKLEDLDVGNHLVMDDSKGTEVQISILSIWWFEHFLYLVRHGRLKCFKDAIRFNEQTLVLHDNWKEALKIYLSSRKQSS
jgi:hypothetical protein